jgi:hypothetical protein
MAQVPIKNKRGRITGYRDSETGATTKKETKYISDPNNTYKPPKSRGGQGNTGGVKAVKEKAAKSEVTKPPFKEKAGRRGANEKLPPNLRYPYSTIDDTQDFIKFSIFTYKRDGMVTRGSTVGEEQEKLKADSLGSIILPIPAQLTDSNSANWKSGNMNFAQEAGLNAARQGMGGDMEGVGKTINQIVSDFKATPIIKEYFATQALNSLGGNMSMESVMARSTGQVINPNMELLFSGPNLRQFSFQFKFTPRFKKEAESVRTIMKAFKRNMAPKGAGGSMLKTPNIFEIQYIGKARQYLNRIKMCALQNVGINFTGDGTFATYQDGSPISSMMTLQFQELTPIYNEDYGAYNDNSDGVGY